MQKHQKQLTGFNFLDQKWGGIYPGGNYLIFGPKKSGKTILVLNVIEYLTDLTQKVLLLTSERQKNLEIQASSIYFDINEAANEDLLKIVRLKKDNFEVDVLKSDIQKFQPSIFIIDEIINESLTEIRESYTEFLEFLENLNISSFFVSSLPINENSRNFVKEVVKNSTGIIRLQKSPENRDYSGVLTIKPNIGHFEGEFETSYKIEPIKGVITLSDNENAIMEILSKSERSETIEKKRDFEYSNLYSYDEFKFLVESKLALSKRTGERIKLFSFDLVGENLKPVEICGKLRAILQEGDKISYSENKIFILPVENHSEYIKKLSNKLEKVISNLKKDSDLSDADYILNIDELNTNFNFS